MAVLDTATAGTAGGEPIPGADAGADRGAEPEAGPVPDDVAVTGADIAAAQRLRHLVFVERGGAVARDDGRERDAFDARCLHVLIEDRASGALVCCFRLLPLARGGEIGRSYAAQFYDLSGLAAFGGPMVEMGRFCLHPDWHDPDILRVAWAEVTRIVDAMGVEMLFGCSSFRGTDAAAYADAFEMLRRRHLAPDPWRPRVKAPQIIHFAPGGRPAPDGPKPDGPTPDRPAPDRHAPDRRRALLSMPPLLRTYLAMGGWVSDHAVVDTRMNTLHVFTGVEISAIPPARARALRAVAG
ncbi:GNAT family N-acetyltransferase [Mesobaculum littorinae]|uniref:L-ornithine N(alpha)-acyltransferase n=1 Tax=Mesobaculum littorinae TaxID=2486419 RepID=A0A438AJY7_9RHOB|nr:GNAT family N-acetyltransferase [Mesobaculum littorinae]RVV98915.1 GNAT family N-acetyltransferase [Mesobaculum littorinae]